MNVRTIEFSFNTQAHKHTHTHIDCFRLNGFWLKIAISPTSECIYNDEKSTEWIFVSIKLIVIDAKFTFNIFFCLWKTSIKYLLKAIDECLFRSLHFLIYQLLINKAWLSFHCQPIAQNEWNSIFSLEREKIQSKIKLKWHSDLNKFLLYFLFFYRCSFV